MNRTNLSLPFQRSGWFEPDETTGEPATIGAGVDLFVDALSAIARIVIQNLNVDAALPAVAAELRTRLDLAIVAIGTTHFDDVHYRGLAPLVDLPAETIPLADSVGREASSGGRTVRYDELGGAEQFMLGDSASMSCACVPLNFDGVTSGFILVVENETKLNARSVDLLEDVGTLIACAQASARQFASERHHLDRLIRLQNITTQIMRTSSDSAVPAELLREIATTFDYASVDMGLLANWALDIRSSTRLGVEGLEEIRYPISEAGILGIAVKSGDPQFISDPARDPSHADLGHPVRQEIVVPLRHEGQILGVLAARSDGRRSLVVDDLGLLLAIAESLALVVQGQQRFASLERRNRQLRVVDSVVAMIAGQSGVRDAFDEICRVIGTRFGYDLVAIGEIDNSGLAYTFAHSTRLAIGSSRESLDLGSMPLGTGVSGRVALTGEPEFIPDVRAEPAYVELGWEAASEICVPIVVDGQVSGVINVESRRGKTLAEDDFEVIKIIANHLGIAWAKDRLLASERASRRAVAAVQKITSIVAGTLEFDEALRLIVDTLSRTFDYPYVVVALIEGDFVVPRAAAGVDVNRLIAVPVGHEVTGRVAASGAPIYLEQLVRNLDDGSGLYADVTSQLVLPIKNEGGVDGVLEISGTPERNLSLRDREVLEMFAVHAGIVLNNARMYDEVRRHATSDAVTGVPNHRAFQDRFLEDFQLAEQLGKPLSLLVIDLDQFKEVNDRYGHLEGDWLLRQISARLLEELRTEDLLARYAGDEFVVLLPDIGVKKAGQIAERLVQCTRSEPFDLEDGTAVRMSITIGVATYPQDATSRLELLRVADAAMYAAKRAGRDSVVQGRQTESE